ncbi:efflux RND transporter periplasmic adaptor subunit [Ideonella dechloratans]|uniref:Efflux RND transporter periplasmic adaptor subunit n=1 Tax=Ideonella dechloratans TaxID=36863 RepID=A0A643F8X8_IDEDE|nr:efflux RND transporter periplasmic adaptor subunit [Ideonella dechloratans]KAB0579061.1 efflux RND transporter periplasmic adaptor subunit [Ideonella dechloratans]UFU10468.1 efflux RND transporter periplasmic adaptor subunit [Ideonella dechloratans]
MSRVQLSVVALAAALVIGGGAFYLGRSSAVSHGGPQVAAPAAAASASGERKVLYWQDPMNPSARFDKPGKSPFMDMQLQPVYADEASDAGVKVSSQVQQNLGIRTAVVKRADVSTSFDAVGAVQFDERLNVAVQTRTAGYLERLAVRAPMERVAKGQALGTVFAPEWLGPLNELIALKRSGASAELVAAARERTRAMSIPADLVRQAEEGGTPNARYTLVAPAGGVIAELGVREGVAVSPGMTLFRIAGLEKVWAVAEVPEAQAVQLKRGQKVSAVLQADPGQTFTGTMQEILPQVNATTRTLQARFEVDNRGGKLVPGMLLRLQVAGPTASRLVVPSEAIIRTGTRAVAIVRKDNGAFEPREVKLGAELGDQLEVLQGLAEGDQVVASGQFLVDSEARLRSVLGSLAAAEPAATQASAPASMPASKAAAAAAASYMAQGKVESVEADSLTISHGAIAELKWPAMTMGFNKPSAKAFPDVKPGDSVHFEFKKKGDDYELVSVHRLGGAK